MSIGLVTAANELKENARSTKREQSPLPAFVYPTHMGTRRRILRKRIDMLVHVMRYETS